MSNVYKRHDLLWLDEEGRRRCLETARPFLAGAPREQLAALIGNPAIPAIVSRQEERRDGVLEAGFASPEKYDGTRLRTAVLVDVPHIVERADPFQVARRIAAMADFPRRAVIDAIAAAAQRRGLEAGFFGSTALQAVTGLPYCDEGSDLDVYARCRNTETDMRGFHDAVADFERECGVRIDVEVEYREVFGVKLKEIFSGVKTVLAKGLYSVELVPVQALGFGPVSGRAR